MLRLMQEKDFNFCREGVLLDDDDNEHELFGNKVKLFIKDEHGNHNYVFTYTLNASACKTIEEIREAITNIDEIRKHVDSYRLKEAQHKLSIYSKLTVWGGRNG